MLQLALHTIVPASVSAAAVTFRIPAELDYSQYVVQLQTVGGVSLQDISFS